VDERAQIGRLRRVARVLGLLPVVGVVALSVGCGEGPPRDSEGRTQSAAARTGSAKPQTVTTVTKAAKPTPSPARSTKAKPAPSTTERAAETASPVALIVFVNVGQGDAILLKSRSTEVLVDGGPGGAAGAVEAAMRKAGMRDLDYVVVSHMHSDHIGCTPTIVARYHPERALIAGPCDRDLRRAFASARTQVRQVRRGASLSFGSVKARVLNPGAVLGDENADSVVLLLDVAGRRILLTGDCTGPNESVVASITARGPPLYVLKVAHHGSRYATSSSFLAETDPRFAIISVGPNPYGHPTPETVSRLRHSGARVYTTQRNGTITLTIRPSGSVTWAFTKSHKPLSKVATAAAKADAASTRGSGGGTTVYVTESGECYHRTDCGCLSHSRIPMSLAETKAQGYRPCSVCDPPR